MHTQLMLPHSNQESYDIIRALANNVVGFPYMSVFSLSCFALPTGRQMFDRNLSNDLPCFGRDYEAPVGKDGVCT